MTRRILGFVIVLIAILVLPYWIYIPVLFLAILVFPFFWEGILFALLINLVHGGGGDILSLLFSPLALMVLIALIMLWLLRKNLRSYA